MISKEDQPRSSTRSSRQQQTIIVSTTTITAEQREKKEEKEHRVNNKLTPISLNKHAWKKYLPSQRKK